MFITYIETYYVEKKMDVENKGMACEYWLNLYKREKKKERPFNRISSSFWSECVLRERERERIRTYIPKPLLVLSCNSTATGSAYSKLLRHEFGHPTKWTSAVHSLRFLAGCCVYMTMLIFPIASAHFCEGKNHKKLGVNCIYKKEQTDYLCTPQITRTCRLISLPTSNEEKENQLSVAAWLLCIFYEMSWRGEEPQKSGDFECRSNHLCICGMRYKYKDIGLLMAVYI
jgi:hypothetical protein